MTTEALNSQARTLIVGVVWPDREGYIVTHCSDTDEIFHLQKQIVFNFLDGIDVLKFDQKIEIKVDAEGKVKAAKLVYSESRGIH